MSFKTTSARKPNSPRCIPKIGVPLSATARANESIVPSPPRDKTKSTLLKSSALFISL